MRAGDVLHDFEEGEISEFTEALFELDKQRDKKFGAELTQREAEEVRKAEAEVAARERGLVIAPAKRRGQADAEYPSSNRFVHIPVMIAWRGALKGTCGTVIGDYDSAERAQRLDAETKAKRKHRIEDVAGILVTIQKDASTQRLEKIPVERLVHKR